MGKIVVSEWITIDGVFDADPEYFEQWFLPYHSQKRGEYITNNIQSGSALLLGGNTYQMLAPFWSSQQNDDAGPASKLNSMPKYVVSAKTTRPIWQNTQKIISDNVVDEITKVKQQVDGDILVLGSATLAESLMQAGLVDEYRFLVHPVIMARGRRFFKDGMPATKLQLTKQESLDLGVVVLHYQAKP